MNVPSCFFYYGSRPKFKCQILKSCQHKILIAPQS